MCTLLGRAPLQAGVSCEGCLSPVCRQGWDLSSVHTPGPLRISLQCLPTPGTATWTGGLASSRLSGKGAQRSPQQTSPSWEVPHEVFFLHYVNLFFPLYFAQKIRVNFNSKIRAPNSDMHGKCHMLHFRLFFCFGSTEAASQLGCPLQGKGCSWHWQLGSQPPRTVGHLSNETPAATR